MKLKALFLAMVAMLMMVCTGCGGSDSKDAAPAPVSSSASTMTDADYIDLVKGGTLNMAPDVPMGAAFDQFFNGANATWTSFVSDDASKDRVVEFSGDCTWNGQPARLLAQFIVDGNTFEMNYIEVDGKQMSHDESLASLKTILDSYKK